jgi:D-aminopeptidase
MEKRARAADLGIRIGRLPRGPYNAITDVPGVLVGHATVIEGQPETDRVKGIARTGVTVVFPHKNIWEEQVYAGAFSLNGNGEMTGLLWVEESGLLGTPIGITNTHSVGMVRDTMISYYFLKNPNSKSRWMIPVVGETWDGFLNDVNGMHVEKEHVLQALDSASSGMVTEGSVGGGTGMVCYEFKGGIGTSSRVISLNGRQFCVAVLVQANYGRRHQLIVDGVPVGEEIPVTEVAGRTDLKETGFAPPHEGSIITIIATDVPLLADQCKRLARRGALGIARAGSMGADSSGDIFLAFSTGNRIHSSLRAPSEEGFTVRTLGHEVLTPIFEAAVESVEEAVLNALCAATTLTGIRKQTAYALPLDRLVGIMRKYGRLKGSPSPTGRGFREM